MTINTDDYFKDLLDIEASQQYHKDILSARRNAKSIEELFDLHVAASVKDGHGVNWGFRDALLYISCVETSDSLNKEEKAYRKKNNIQKLLGIKFHDKEFISYFRSALDEIFRYNPLAFFEKSESLLLNGLLKEKVASVATNLYENEQIARNLCDQRGNSHSREFVFNYLRRAQFTVIYLSPTEDYPDNNSENYIWLDEDGIYL